jgi:thiol-disulfide isomerase/thioredoxin
VPPGAGDSVENAGLVVLVVALVAATAFGLWRRRTDGRLRAVAPTARKSPLGVPAPDGAPVFPASALGITLGERASLVQFSTAFCQPCRATRRVLAEVAELVDGVTAAEVDAEAHLDLVRQWDVMRTPTVFVLDASGAVRQRAVGQPRKADVIAAVGALVAPTGPEHPVDET